MVSVAQSVEGVWGGFEDFSIRMNGKDFAAKAQYFKKFKRYECHVIWTFDKFCSMCCSMTMLKRREMVLP